MHHMFQITRGPEDSWRFAMITVDDDQHRVRNMPVGTVILQRRPTELHAWLTVDVHARLPSDVRGVEAVIDSTGILSMYFGVESLNELETAVDRHLASEPLLIGHRVQVKAGDLNGDSLAGATGIVTDNEDVLLAFDATYRESQISAMQRMRFELIAGKRGVRLDAPVGGVETVMIDADLLERLV